MLEFPATSDTRMVVASSDVSYQQGWTEAPTDSRMLMSPLDGTAPAWDDGAFIPEFYASDAAGAGQGWSNPFAAPILSLPDWYESYAYGPQNVSSTANQSAFLTVVEDRGIEAISQGGPPGADGSAGADGADGVWLDRSRRTNGGGTPSPFRRTTDATAANPVKGSLITTSPSMAVRSLVTGVSAGTGELGEPLLRLLFRNVRRRDDGTWEFEDDDVSTASISGLVYGGDVYFTVHVPTDAP